jgi:predicted nucleic acid-binding protein
LAVKTLGIERYKSDPLELFLYATEAELTAYDASYLLLAKRCQCPIASFDKLIINKILSSLSSRSINPLLLAKVGGGSFKTPLMPR